VEYQDYILEDSGSSFHAGEVLNSQRMLEHGAIVLSASGMPSFGGSFVCSSSHLMLVEMRIWTLWEANTLDEQLGSVVFFFLVESFGWEYLGGSYQNYMLVPHEHNLYTTLTITFYRYIKKR